MVQSNHPISHCVVDDKVTKVDNKGNSFKGTSVADNLASADYSFYPGTPAPLPIDAPKFTIKDIREAIPSHCFERSALVASVYLFWNLILVGALFYLSTYIGHPSLPSWTTYFLWPIYWFVQGSYMTGIWVIAHECGHQAFSEYRWLNDSVGLVLHSALLVPYHSWRITHRRHHSNTGSCENDEVFVPPTRDESTKSSWDIFEDAPLYNLYQIVVMLVVGWMPGYLIFNATGPKKYYKKNVNHFSIYAEFFSVRERGQVAVGIVGFFIALGCLIFFAYRHSFTSLVFYYLIPYMVTNHNLVLITYLQHTDTYIPHFRGGEWNWLRGALCTVDRSFGFWLDGVFHHIADTHVCHHLFSTMPFYHAREATEAMKKVLGKYYLKDDTPILKALWRSFTKCKYVDSKKGIVFYKSR